MENQRLAAETSGRSEMYVQGVTDYAICMLDPVGKVTSWNAGAERLKGYSAEEIIGEHYSCFYAEDDQACGMPALMLATAMRDGRFETQGWRVRKDGTRFWANVIIDPVRDLANRLVGFVKITRNLTEKREMEQARESFFQAQKLDALGKLTGGVAHDFNNLLHVIIGSLDRARRRLAEGRDAAPLIDNAVAAAERGATLTQRMLAFARKQELRIERVDLPSLVGRMVGLLQRTLGPGVLIETRFPAGLPCVQADRLQLELALVNLAVNADHAMPGGGTIVVAAREEALPQDNGLNLAMGDYVCLAVSDPGEGMDAETLARACEPFFTTKEVGKGAGMGLSMVDGFAEQCGGRLRMRSGMGEGTTAEIWLRVAAPAAQDEPRRVPTADGRVAGGEPAVRSPCAG